MARARLPIVNLGGRDADRRCKPVRRPPRWLQAEKSQVETTVRRISHQLNRLEIKRPEIKRCRRLKRPPVESAGEGPRKLSADARRLGA